MKEGAGLPGSRADDVNAPKLERLESTLAHLERLCGRLEQAERQFKKLTDECGDVLQNLVFVDRSHSAAIAGLNERLSNWCDLERKLLEESARRIDSFERGVGYEWKVLRRLHEEPLEELRAQADELRRACIEAARIASQRLESVDRAYAAHTAALERRMDDWGRQLLTTAEAGLAGGTLGAGPGPDQAGLPPAGGARLEPWPLEGVARLHQELRSGRPPGSPVGGDGARRESDGVIDARPETASQEDPNEPDQPLHDGPRDGSGRRWSFLPAFLAASAVIVLVLAVALGFKLQPAGRVMEEEDPPAAKTPPVEAERPAESSSEERLADIQQAAERAMTIVDILAAPDLRRYPLSGLQAAPRASAQLLWSSSRGLAVTATHLPQLAPGKVYQVWIVSQGAPVSLGLLVLDEEGRGSLTMPGQLSVPRPGVVQVTLEDNPGAKVPTGPTALMWAPAT